MPKNREKNRQKRKKQLGNRKFQKVVKKAKNIEKSRKKK